MSLPGSLSRRAAPSIAETAALVERITMEADLRQALVAGDLVLRYQPIIDLGTARILAFETLCRWRHWSKGLLGPAEFMPLAEETGLIGPLGGWVLEESCRRLAQWRARLDEARPLDVTVNLSAVELRDPGLVDRAAQALDNSGLPAGNLVVEVSEAAAYAEPHGPAVANLSALVELGVGVAVDDIGVPRPGHRTGRPDPDGWLWTLPVRLLKIERGVAAGVSEGAAGGRAGRVLGTTLRLAAERGVPVVAKGIETPEQLALFRKVGCPAGQGFLFARPMDPSDAEAYLRRGGRPGRF
ncbi:MAG: EAL domain-containing protein [Actinomycetota bacterium]|jgi:EAL domain-containing protein (putative c-di-GMP-specific phosphodiesterase class I)